MNNAASRSGEWGFLARRPSALFSMAILAVIAGLAGTARTELASSEAAGILGDEHAVLLRAMGADGKPAAKVRGENFIFNVWKESGNFQSSEGADPLSQKHLPDGTYLVSATRGDHASPITMIRLNPTTRSQDLALVLQPCPPFDVRFIDQHGTPLVGIDFIHLGLESKESIPNPCRLTFVCQDGLATFSGVLPGRYVVQMGGLNRGVATTVELKPGGGPVTVTVP